MCDLTSGRDIKCLTSVGGLTAVYMSEAADIPKSSVVYDATDTDMIDTLNATPSTVDSWKYELLNNGSSFSQNIVADEAAGTVIVEQTLTVMLKVQDKDMHKELNNLMRTLCKIVVQDANGNFFLMGTEFGARVNGGTINSGAALAEANGYEVTFVARELKPANFIDSADEAGLAAVGLNVQ